MTVSCTDSSDCPVVSGTYAFCWSSNCQCPKGYNYESFAGGKICRLMLCYGNNDCAGHGTCVNNNDGGV